MSLIKETNKGNKMQPKIEDELNFFKRYNMLYQKRHKMMLHIKNKLKIKYPNIDEIYIDECSYTISTKHHVLRRSKHALQTFQDVPTFICQKKMSPMDMTSEEFTKMKEDIKNDYQQCLSAIYYIQFRHEIRD